MSPIATPPLTIVSLNEFSRTRFVAALGGIFEHSPWVAEAAWTDAPFADVASLHAAMAQAVRSSPAARQLALLNAHPDLAGKTARANEMTAHSMAEQGDAGLLSLSEAEYAHLTALNDAYRQRFGFPFIIAVRQHDKASLLATFEARLANQRDTEIETALGEVFKITRLRLDAMFSANVAVP